MTNYREKTVNSFNGIFIFDTRFPSKEELIQPPTEEYWTTITDEKGRRCDLYTEMNYDSIQQIQHYITTRRFYEEDTLVEELKNNNRSSVYVSARIRKITCSEWV